MIVHSNSTYNGISVNSLYGEPYGDEGKTTDMFTHEGIAYDRIVILTPIPGNNE